MKKKQNCNGYGHFRSGGHWAGAQSERVQSTLPALSLSLCRAHPHFCLLLPLFYQSEVDIGWFRFQICACVWVWSRERERVKMFGKVRASSCPAESLERPPSKILKDDSLSIYEATLMKLKLGSKRNLSPCSNEVVGEIYNGSTSSSSNSEPIKIDLNCASAAASRGHTEVASSPQEQEEFMTLDTDCSSVTSSTSSTDCHSLGTSKQQRSTNVSVLYLFSKFKRAQEDICSSSGDAMTKESASISPSCSGCQSLNSTEQRLEMECVNSLPASHICML